MFSIRSLFSRSAAQDVIQLEQSPAAIVVCGWSGAGKTEMISRLASIGANQISVLLTELNQGSVSIDLSRLPSTVEKVGMAGCTCCQLFSKVSRRIGDDHKNGKLNIIEVGPLSDPAVLLDGLRTAGVRSAGVFLFNPGQTNEAFAPAQIRGIESADLIVVTHTDSAGEFQAAKEYILNIRARGAGGSYKIVANRERHLPPKEIWRECASILNGTQISQRNTASGDSHLSFATFQNQMKLAYSELPFTPIHGVPTDILKAVRAFNIENPGVIDRVKGIVDSGVQGTVDFDIITQNGDLILNERKLSGSSHSGAFISIRSYKSDLRPLVADLARYCVAVPVIDQRLVDEQIATYPDATAVRGLVARGDVPMKFAPDLYLRDLQVVIPEIKDAPTAVQLGVAKAVVAYLRRSVEARLDLVDALKARLEEVPANDSSQVSVREGLMNACLFLSEVLFFYRNLQSYHKFLGDELVARAHSVRPAETLVSCMGLVAPLRFHGQGPLYAYQLEHVARVVAAAHGQGAIEKKAVEVLLSHLKSSRDLTVLGALRNFQSALGLF